MNADQEVPFETQAPEKFNEDDNQTVTTGDFRLGSNETIGGLQVPIKIAEEDIKEPEITIDLSELDLQPVDSVIEIKDEQVDMKLPKP